MQANLGLIPISPLTLKVGVPMGVNIYDWHSAESPPILLAAADVAIAENEYHRLCENPARPLYIDRYQQNSYQKYLR